MHTRDVQAEANLIVIKDKITLDLSSLDHLKIEVNNVPRYLSLLEAALIRNSLSRWMNNVRHKDNKKES